MRIGDLEEGKKAYPTAARSNGMPDTEFRLLPPDRRKEYQRIVEYAFSPEDGVREEPVDHGDEPGDAFGIFVDGDLVSVCKHYDFEASLRGTWVPLAGLAAVATPPEHRRRGHVRATIDASLDRWRDKFPLAALWPFERAFYRRFGWATANNYLEYSCSPTALSFARDATEGRFKQVTPDEWRTLRPAHETHALRRTLTLRRDEAWWRDRVFRTLDDDRPYVYTYERGDEVRGYLVYTVERTGDGVDDRELEVRELVAVDEAAHRSLLGFLADHDSQVDSVTVSTEDGNKLLDRFDDPSAVDCRRHAGPMVRIVDVEHALAAVPYPDDVSADLVFRVTDETAPWNDGVFHLDVSGGAGECARVADPPDTVGASLDIGTLSQLAVGYHSVADARRVADLTVDDAALTTALASLFPPETVRLRTFF